MVFSRQFIQSTTALMFIFSFVLPPLLQAIPMEDDSEEKAPSFKMELQDDDQTLKKTKLEKEPEETGSEVYTFWTDPTYKGVESRTRICSFLSPSDRMNWRLVSRRLRDDADSFLQSWDGKRRKLADIVWLGGPKKGTIENYKLNASLWYVFSHILRVDERLDTPETSTFMNSIFGSPSDPLEPLTNVYLYLQELLKDKDSVSEEKRFIEEICKFLSDVYNYLDEGRGFVLEVSEFLEEGAKSPDNTGNQELMRLFSQLTKEGYNAGEGPYADLKEDLTMGPVKRFLTVSEVRKNLTRPPIQGMSLEEGKEAWKKRAEEYEYILTYGFHPIEDFSNELSSTLHDFRLASEANYRAKKYAQSNELAEKVLSLFPNFDPVDLRIAAETNYWVQDYARSAELWNRFLSLHRSPWDPKPSIEDIKMAARANYRAKNYAQSADLWKKFLFLNRNAWDPKPSIKDFKEMAKANHTVIELIEKAFLDSGLTSKNYCSSLALEKFEAIVLGFKLAAQVDYLAENYEQSAELWEKFLLLDRKPWHSKPSIEDFKMAAQANHAAGNYVRETELNNKVLKLCSEAISNRSCNNLFIKKF